MLYFDRSLYNFLKELIEKKRKEKEQRMAAKIKEKELNEIQHKKIPASVLTWVTFNNPNVKKEDKLFGDFDDFLILIQALEYPELPDLPFHMQGDNFFIPNTLKTFYLNGDGLGGCTVGKLTEEIIENLKEANLYKDYYKDCVVKIKKLEIKAKYDIGNDRCYISLSGEKDFKVEYEEYCVDENFATENLTKDLLTDLEIYENRAIISIRDVDNIRKLFYNAYTQKPIKENELKSRIENRDKKYKEAQDFVNSLKTK